MDREAQPDLRRLIDVAVQRTQATEVAVIGIEKSYGATRAVQDVSFTVEPGNLLSLLGPSGCGKTTIMRMIAGLIDPTAGHIRIAGKVINDVPVHRRQIGMLFQNYALFPHLSVARNVAFGLEMRRVPKASIEQQVKAALATVQLAHLGERLPHQLSGGQQQRVALARALIVKPTVLLLDEPFGALDKKLRESMQIEMRQLQRRLGITTLMVTHDQDEALTLSDRVAVMNHGRIEQIGTPQEIYDTPATRFVAAFIGTSNFVTGTITHRDVGGYAVTSADGLILQVDGAPPERAAVTVALRPEAITVEKAGPVAPVGPNSSRLTVEQVVYHGLNTHVHLRRPGGEPLIAVRQNVGPGALDASLDPGTPVDVHWDASRNRVVLDEAA